MKHKIVGVIVAPSVAFTVCACGRTFQYNPDAHDPRLELEIKMTEHIREANAA